jgi:lipopolysaccharide transport system ATP-binding protein
LPDWLVLREWTARMPMWCERAMTEWAIRAEDLGKLYFPGNRRGVTGLRETLAARTRGAFRSPSAGLSGRGRTPGEESISAPVWALRHVCLEARRGEAVGILGSNGAGKTTLLRILSRITFPSEGSAQIRGRVAALLDFGAALHGELTGRENVHLYGAILGMAKAEACGKFDAIVAFAGLERFIDIPVKRYSTGMCLRLAFSVVAHLEPDVLMVDDVLGAADAAFREKCLERITAAAGQGRAVLLVSHEPEHVRRYCGRGIVLAGGKVVYSGPAEEAADFYCASGDPAYQPEFARLEESRKEY